MSNKSYRPQDKTLRKVIPYLESIGLYLYGDNVDLEKGEIHYAQRDYDTEDALKYRQLKEKGLLQDCRK